MKRLGEWLRDLIPRRRLRAWRHVSARRHSVGVIVLLALASALYAYWFLTNDRQIRHQARTYLAELTGADWRVQAAHFSLFGGIELQGVELRAPGLDQPFFRAERVLLRHHPWGLLAHQRLDVREIACEGAVAQLVYDVSSNSFKYPKLRFSMGGGAEGHGPGPWWPPLVARGAKVLVTYRDANIAVENRGEWTSIAGVSRAGNIYEISLAGDQKGASPRIGGAFGVNMLSGEIASVSGIEVQDVSLLQQFRALKDLGIHGRLTATGRWDPQSGQGFLDANLSDASMDLPAILGGMGLRSATGQLHLDANGILVRGLSGHLYLDANGVLVHGLLKHVPHAAGARVSVSGMYGGFEANSPFDFHVAVQGLAVSTELTDKGPVAGTGPAATTRPIATTGPAADEGPLAGVVKYVREHYKVEGTLDAVSARLARGPDGRLTVEGNAVAAGLVTMDRSFPYEVRNTQLVVQFTDRWLEFHQLKGTHGSAQISVTGRSRFSAEGKTFDLLVQGREVPIEADVYAALSADQKLMWDSVRPTGKLGADVRVHCDAPGAPEKQDVTLLMDGAASMEYEDFPYRLANVYGQVQLDGRDIVIHPLTGTSPGMTCTVEGAIHMDEQFRGEANLTVTARLPLDRRLENALGKQGKAAFKALRPDGNARNVRARIWRRPGEEPWFHVTTELEEGSLTFDRFPYTITNANGLLVLEPNEAIFQGITGRHNDTPIIMSGHVSYGEDRVVIDMRMDANSVRADQDLFQAVPPSVQRVWKRMSPSGLADVGFRLHWNMADDANAPVDPNDMDYECRIQARDMGLKDAAFPYALRGLSGLAIVTPNCVELRGVTGSDGNMRLALDGNVTAGEKEDRADLRLRADNIPLGAELLSALPLQAVPIFSRLKPGGLCNLNFSRLVVIRAAGEAAPRVGNPATHAGETLTGKLPMPRASGPMAASGPLAPLEGPVTEWLLEGEMSLKDADVDLGIPAKLTGGLWGQIARTREGLRIDANLLLGSLGINQRVISDVRGRMSKDANSTLIHIDDIVGKAYGGRLAGFAEVRVGDVPEYGLRIFAEGMNLGDIFNASLAEPNQRVAAEGLLDATIELKFTGGPKPIRRVSGLLHLTKAKTQKLPVLVDQIQPVFLSLPEGTFSEGVAEYTLKEDKILFREIHLVGQGMSIVGSGTMDLKTEALKLTFLSRPGLVPRMDNLADEMIGGILRELVEIQVTGTLKKPRFRSVPLRGVDNIVRKLLNPEAE